MEDGQFSSWLLWRFYVGDTVRLRIGSTSIGRHSTCTIRVTRDYVSRQHAVIYIHKDDKQVELREIQSANGVYVNGVFFNKSPVSLKNGDKIGIGILEMPAHDNPHEVCPVYVLFHQPLNMLPLNFVVPRPNAILAVNDVNSTNDAGVLADETIKNLENQTTPKNRLVAKIKSELETEVNSNVSSKKKTSNSEDKNNDTPSTGNNTTLDYIVTQKNDVSKSRYSVASVNLRGGDSTVSLPSSTGYKNTLLSSVNFDKVNTADNVDVIELSDSDTEEGMEISNSQMVLPAIEKLNETAKDKEKKDISNLHVLGATDKLFSLESLEASILKGKDEKLLACADIQQEKTSNLSLSTSIEKEKGDLKKEFIEISESDSEDNIVIPVSQKFLDPVELAAPATDGKLTSNIPSSFNVTQNLANLFKDDVLNVSAQRFNTQTKHVSFMSPIRNELVDSATKNVKDIFGEPDDFILDQMKEINHAVYETLNKENLKCTEKSKVCEKNLKQNQNFNVFNNENEDDVAILGFLTSNDDEHLLPTPSRKSPDVFEDYFEGERQFNNDKIGVNENVSSNNNYRKFSTDVTPDLSEDEDFMFSQAVINEMKADVDSCSPTYTNRDTNVFCTDIINENSKELPSETKTFWFDEDDEEIDEELEQKVNDWSSKLSQSMSNKSQFVILSDDEDFVENGPSEIIQDIDANLYVNEEYSLEEKAPDLNEETSKEGNILKPEYEQSVSSEVIDSPRSYILKRRHSISATPSTEQRLSDEISNNVIVSPPSTDLNSPLSPNFRSEKSKKLRQSSTSSSSGEDEQTNSKRFKSANENQEESFIKKPPPPLRIYRAPEVIEPPSLPRHKGKHRGFTAEKKLSTSDNIREEGSSKELTNKWREKAKDSGKRKCKELSTIKETRRTKLKELAEKRSSKSRSPHRMTYSHSDDGKPNDKGNEDQTLDEGKKSCFQNARNFSHSNRGAFLTEEVPKVTGRIPKKREIGRQSLDGSFSKGKSNTDEKTSKTLNDKSDQSSKEKHQTLTAENDKANQNAATLSGVNSKMSDERNQSSHATNKIHKSSSLLSSSSSTKSSVHSSGKENSSTDNLGKVLDTKCSRDNSKEKSNLSSSRSSKIIRSKSNDEKTSSFSREMTKIDILPTTVEESDKTSAKVSADRLTKKLSFASMQKRFEENCEVSRKLEQIGINNQIQQQHSSGAFKQNKLASTGLEVNTNDLERNNATKPQPAPCAKDPRIRTAAYPKMVANSTLQLPDFTKEADPQSLLNKGNTPGIKIPHPFPTFYNKDSTSKPQKSILRLSKKKTAPKRVTFADKPSILYIQRVAGAIRKVDCKDARLLSTYSDRAQMNRRNFKVVEMTDKNILNFLQWSNEWLINKDANATAAAEQLFPLPNKFRSIEQYEALFLAHMRLEFQSMIEREYKHTKNIKKFSATLENVFNKEDRTVFICKMKTRCDSFKYEMVILDFAGKKNCFAYVSGIRRGFDSIAVILYILPDQEIYAICQTIKDIWINPVVDNVKVDFGAFNAIHQIKESPLVGAILNPLNLLEVRTLLNSSPIYKGYDILNNEQKEALLKTYQRVINENAPNMTLIHGPPGTGKSCVIANLALQCLYGEEVRYLDKKVLICAQSNCAIDVITLKLLKISKKMRPESRFRVVRFGVTDKIDARVKPIGLSNIVKNHYYKRVLGRDENIDYSNVQAIQEQIIELEASILEIKRRNWRGTVLEDQVNKKYNQLEILKSAVSNNIRPEDERELSRNFLRNSHIICTTLSSCVKLSQYIDYLDICIIDEATQCTEPWTLLPLRFGLKSLVLVGDTQQLPATVLSKKAAEFGLGVSMFTRVQNCLDMFYGNRDGYHKPENTISYKLKVQYRMHPEICKWPNFYFYENKLLNAPITASIQSPILPFSILSLSYNQNANCCQGQITNNLEAEFVAKLLKSLNKYLPTNLNSYGIITPYANHRNALEKEIKKLHGLASIMVNTIDSYQGVEKDVIIISNARTSGVGFLANYQRLNVALTRPKKCLLLCGNFKNLETVPAWRNLLQNARERKLFFEISPKGLNDMEAHVMSRLKCPKFNALNENKQPAIPVTSLPVKDPRKIPAKKPQISQPTAQVPEPIPKSKDIRIHSSPPSPPPHYPLTPEICSKKKHNT